MNLLSNKVSVNWRNEARMWGLSMLFIFCVGFSFPANLLYAQGTVSGTIIDATTGEALPGATVSIVGTQAGASTDINGQYEITGVPAGTYLLRARFVGFIPLDRPDVVVTNGQITTVDFGLTESAIDLEEISVVGYGVVRSEDVTGALGVIDTENISAMPLMSVDQALQGQVSGVTVRTAQGTPGSGPVIQVRGTGNVGAGGQPLYVVDGFALPQPSQTTAVTRNPLTDIPPEDIESITVLKDASATAIYGSRASNGVVIITTKGGSAGPLQFNISASTGVNSPIDRMQIDAATGREFAFFQNVIWNGRVADGQASEVPSQYVNPDQYGAGTNWWDEIYRNANQYNIQLSASGGSASLRSYFSAGYTRNEGQVLNSDFNRISLRANLEADLSPTITAGLRVAPVFSIRNLNYEGGIGRGGNGGAGGGPWMMCPLDSPTLPDGSMNPQIGAAPGFECPGVWSQPNPIQWLEEEKDREESLRALASAFVNYEVLPGLQLRQSFNVDYGTANREEFTPSTIGRIRNPPPRVPTGRLRTSSALNWLSETTLNWSGQVGPGQLDVLGGWTIQEENILTSNFAGQFPNDDIQTLNVASNLTGNTNDTGWTLLSALGRVNYNFRDRFILTGTFRTDGSSRFGEDNRWASFPSGAIAWNLHNESFMQGYRQDVPELRLRVSYGETGNNQIGNFSSLGVVQQLDYVLGGAVAAGRVLNTLGNTALTWEESREVNVGLDAALHNYKMRISVDYYVRNTTSLLLNRELPLLSGFNTVTENLGEVQNRGVEFSINTSNVSTPKFSWTTNFNVALNQNEVTELPGGFDIRYGGEGPAEYIHREGLPLASYVGYVVDGLYTQEQIDNGSITLYAGAAPGTIIFRDLNNDGIISERVMQPRGDFAVIGDAYHDFTFGMTNSFSFGNVDVRALITGAFGGDNLRSEFFRTARNIDGLFIIDSGYVRNMWISPQQPGDGLTPSPLGGAFGRQQYRDNLHSLAISDASYIWLRNLLVRYNFQRGPFAGSSIYLSGDNLLILSGYPGNPDVTDIETDNIQPGLDFGNYPIPRAFTFGLELSL